MPFLAGVSRVRLSPFWGVELAGMGYYLERTWEGIHDDLTATALVVDDGRQRAALVAVDLMYLNAEFVRGVRSLAAASTDLLPESITIGASHSHNAPNAAQVRGVGAMDPAYVSWARRQTATAVIMAWRQRQEATLRAGSHVLEGWTFNRTRENGPRDTRASVLRVDDRRGRPFAFVTNFAAHPTVHADARWREVSRDYPGEVNDALETLFPGSTALFLQGCCGDVNFLLKYRRNPEIGDEPGRALAGAVLEALAAARPVENPSVAAASMRVLLPTRRYDRQEVQAELEEGRHRLRTGDTTGWRDSLGRVMVNQPDRFPSRYGGDLGLAVRALSRFAVEWTEEILKDLDTRPETLETEVHAVRLGDVHFVSQPAELFSRFALDLRAAWPAQDLFIIGYANDGISYVPDDHDIAKRSYAAAQSPKYMGNFPFTVESGPALVRGMLASLERASP
ncbi:MAG: hypothetical protein HYU36_16850 [Planctomycetes bacterium]|nr:hypothetical protein [Planctomycetota bacterium]